MDGSLEVYDALEDAALEAATGELGEVALDGATSLTGVAAVDRVVFRYRRQGAEVDVIGMNQTCRTLIDKVGKHDNSHLPTASAH